MHYQIDVRQVTDDDGGHCYRWTVTINGVHKAGGYCATVEEAFSDASGFV